MNESTLSIYFKNIDRIMIASSSVAKACFVLIYGPHYQWY